MEPCREVVWGIDRPVGGYADRPVIFVWRVSGRARWCERYGGVPRFEGEIDDQSMGLRIAQSDGASAGFDAPLDDGESESESA